MNEDERMDEVLRRAAQDYNSPPDTIPRDEMWGAISAAISQPAPARGEHSLRVVRGGNGRPAPRRYFLWTSMAAAAVALLAIGVGVGRWSAVDVRTTGAVAAVSEIEPAGEAARAGDSGVMTPAESQSRPSVVAGREPQTPRDTRQLATGTARTRQAPQSRPRNGGAPDAAETNPYQVATIRHLSNAEALLTSFRHNEQDERLNAQLSTWARDLLSGTRLLLDSPAAEDPLRNRLLQDLELVLAQIVLLSPGSTSQERELIQGTLQNGQMMTRLRSAIPAGPTRGL